jgi:anti-sigma-K factor RskA
MSDIGPELPEDEALAAEHALGVLSGPERAAAQARMARDPDFAAAVETWRARLAPLADEIPAVEPAAALWPRIERALPANDNAAGRAAFWRRTAFGSMGLAAASVAAAVFMAVQPPTVVTREPPMAPMMNARLASTAGQPLFLAAYDASRKMVMVASLVPPGADPNHSHELWLIPADGKPRSLGLIDPGASKAMPMPEPMMPMMHEGVSLAVSVEPMGGSRQDGPSGPIAAVGKLQRL